MRLIKTVILTSILLHSAASQAATSVSSTFDTTAEDWQTIDFFPGDPQNPLTPTHDVTGSISTFDTHTWNVFSAPSKFLGNKTSFLGGTISFDLSVSQASPFPVPQLPVIVLTNGTQYIGIQASSIPNSTTHFSFNLNASDWLTPNSSFTAGVTATSADFAAVLANITGLYINADYYTAGNDHAILDNVFMTAAIPEPETYSMLLAGLCLVISLRKRHNA